MKRFTASPVGQETSCFQILLENYGTTMYYAQIFESDLQIVISALEVAGLITIDREQYRFSDDSSGVIIEACIGPMIHILQNHAHFDVPSDLLKILKKTNMQRNYLAHSFLLQHSDEMLSEPGQIAVNDYLYKLYMGIRRGQQLTESLRNSICEHLGVSRTEIDRRIRELKEAASGDVSLDDDQVT